MPRFHWALLDMAGIFCYTITKAGRKNPASISKFLTKDLNYRKSFILPKI